MAIRPIGLHVSPEVKIEFFEQEDTSVKASVSNIQDDVEVVLPETQNSCVLGFSSLATKVESLLRNCHLKPVYIANQNQIQFKPFCAGGTSWEKKNEISVPFTSDHTDYKWICRSNGMISYAFINTVKTWNPVNNEWTVVSYPITKITALAEDANGVLVVGDEKGQLYISGAVYFTGIAEVIEEIIPTTPHHFLVKFPNQQAIIFDLVSRAILIKIDFEEYSEKRSIFIIGHGSVVSLNKKTIVVHRYDSQKKEYQESNFDLKGVIRICLLSRTKLLILHKEEDKKSLTLWNFETDKRELFEDDYLWQCCRGKVIWLDEKTFVTRLSGSPSFYSNGEIIDTPRQGGWGVNDMILLSNGSVMYGTDCRGSGIYVVNKNGDLLFSRKTGDRKIESLQELVDGSVAVKFSDSILILKPCFKELEDINYQIEQLHLQLRYNSSKLMLYHELAALYEKKNEAPYQIYLSGLEAAVRCNKLYQARRFYKKARRIDLKNAEPIRNFQLYLHKSPHEKLKRQISLDLFALVPNMESIRSLTDRECKKRLLVGEGDFSFTEAFLIKHKKSHPKLGRSITATEVLAPVDKSVFDRIDSLQKQGVTIFFDVDAQNIHSLFQGRRFERIQWNCPFGDASPKSRKVFPEVLPAFFQSCSVLQLAGDRVHVTLVQKDPDEPSEFWKKRQKENPIVLASVSSNYRLIRKRHFETDRYPQYLHVKTGTLVPYLAGGNEREFVFEKVVKEMPKQSFYDRAIGLKDPAQKAYEISTDKQENPLPEDYYFECSTDEDSSDCYESD